MKIPTTTINQVAATHKLTTRQATDEILFALYLMGFDTSDISTDTRWNDFTEEDWTAVAESVQL